MDESQKERNSNLCESWKTKVDLFMQIILECFSVFGFSTIIALYTGDKMLIVLEKFLDWKSIGAFTSMQIYAQNKDICYLILSGTIILLLSISISLFQYYVQSQKNFSRNGGIT